MFGEGERILRFPCEMGPEAIVYSEHPKEDLTGETYLAEVEVRGDLQRLWRANEMGMIRTSRPKGPVETIREEDTVPVMGSPHREAKQTDKRKKQGSA